MTTTAATISNVTYDGSNVVVQWSPATAGSVTGYQIQVTSADYGVTFQSPVIQGNSATSGTLTVPGALNTNIVFTLQVVSQTSGGPGDASPAVPLLTALPEIGEIYYDGADLHFEWGIAQPPGQGYQLAVISTASGTSYRVDVPDPLAWSAVIPASALPQGGLDPTQTWIVQIAALGLNGVYATTASTSLPAGLPALNITSAQYEGGNRIVLLWTAPGGGWIDHYQIEANSLQGDPSYSILIPSALATSGTLPIDLPLPAAQSYQVRLKAFNAGGVGMASPAMPVVHPAAAITGTVYDGAEVTLSWLPSADPSVTGYTAQVVSLASGQSWSGAATSTGGSVTTGQLTPALDCVARTTAQCAGSASAVSLNAPILAAQATISTVRYDEATLAVGWVPPASPGVTALVVSRLVDGTVAESATLRDPGATNHIFFLDQPLASDHAHSVQVAALAEGGASSVSAPVTVSTALPDLQYANYDGTKVTAGWAGLAGATGFTLEIDSPGAAYQADVPGVATSATLALPGMLGDGGACRLVLSARLAGGVSVATPPLPLPTTLPVVSSAVYDGNQLAVEWESHPDAAATLTGWQATLLSTSSGVNYQASSDDPLVQSLTIGGLPAKGIDAAQSWVLVLAAQFENGITAATPHLALVAVRPKLGYSTYAGDRIVASWASLSDPSQSVAGFDLSVTGSGLNVPAEIYLPGAPTTSGMLVLEQPLQTNGSYSLTLAAVSNDGILTLGDPVAINSALPTDLRLVYDGTQVAMTWAPALSPAATGQELTVIGPASGMTYRQAIANTQTGYGAVAVTQGLPPDQPWQAQVWATGGVNGGSLALPVLVTRPAVTSVLYDGASVALAWTPVADPRVTGYRVTVTPPSGAAVSLDVEGVLSAAATLALVAPLPATGNSQITVTALAGAVQSLSDPVVLDVAQPQVSSILYAGGQVALAWTASANPDVTGYVVTVEGSTGASYSQAVSGKSTAAATVAVGGALGTDQGWLVQVRTVTAAGIAAGSTPAGLIAEIPVLTAVAYSGTELDAAWSAEPDAVFGLAGFELVVRPTSSSTPSYETAIDDPLARAGSVTAGGLVDGLVAEIRAVAASGAMTASAPVPVIVSSPGGLTLTYDGTVLRAAWTAQSGATAYRLALTDPQNNPLAAETVCGTNLLLPGPLDPSIAAKAAVAQIDGISRGPDSAAVCVLAGLCVITSVDSEGTVATVTWAPPQVTTGITSYLVRLYENGTVKDSKTSTDGSPVAFTIAAPDAGSLYETTVQPQGSSTIGGESVPAPVLLAAPAGLKAVLEGPLLAANWQALTDPRVTGYGVSLAQGSTPVATATVEATSATLPLAIPAAATGRFAATVRAQAGVATGPASAAIAVWGQGYQYLQQAAQPTVVPYLYRAQSAAPPTTPAAAFTLYLPQLFGTTPATLPITSGSFSLATATTGSAYPYMMSFAADSPVWSFDNTSIRAGLRADFDAFLVLVEQAGTTEFGLGLLRQVLALGLPLTYAETLYYRYGFDTANRYCDLISGMGIALSGQMFQFEGTSASATNLSGFVPGGTGEYAVGTYLSASGTHLNGFDAFLSMLNSLSVPVNTRGSGGLADLYATGFRRPYWRILYPASLNGGDSNGSYSFSNNMAVLGCNSFADLQSATQTYLVNGSFSTSTVDYAATFFRGRMAGLPQLRLSVDGQLRSVPIGTTIRQLAAGIGQLPMATGILFSGMSLTRQTGCLVNCLQTDLQQRVDEQNPVALSAAAYTIQTGQADIFDLPVLGGDSLMIL